MQLMLYQFASAFSCNVLWERKVPLDQLCYDRCLQNCRLVHVHTDLSDALWTFVKAMLTSFDEQPTWLQSICSRMM